MSTQSDIENCGVEYLNYHGKLKFILKDIDIERLERYVFDISNKKYLNKSDFSQYSKTMQKKHSIKPKLIQTNYMYRKLLNDKKVSRNKELEVFLTSKLSRKLSGILQISVLTSPELFSCKHDCAYCPNFEGMPRSYIPNEPACRRAAQNNFKADLQFIDRAITYDLSQHSNDKIEVIVLGGTFDDYPWDYRKEFVRDLFWAANTLFDVNKRDKLSLKEEQTINESAACKIIGLTIESRPDYVKKPENILSYLELGVTRVQYGVQSIYDDVLNLIKRGCKHKDAIEASKMIHDSGYKSIIHIMPNLPYPDGNGGMYTSVEKDEEMFNYLIHSEECQSDEWKIYPTSIPKADEGEKVHHNTKIEKWFEEGTYVPYSDQELIELAVRVKKTLFNQDFKHLRIARFIRDIPMGNIQGGASIPNMRQLVHKRLNDEGFSCPCIRCREIKNRDISDKNVETRVKKYRASGGDEYFISKVVNIDSEEYLIGFIRLRLSPSAGGNFLPVLKNSALIRELHVYGFKNTAKVNNTNDLKYIISIFLGIVMLFGYFLISNNYVSIGKYLSYITFITLYTGVHIYVGNISFNFNTNSYSNTQHKGYGRSLLKEAEKIAIKNGYKKMSIISGVGVRNYYRKFGYELDSGYMTKKLVTIESSTILSILFILIPFFISKQMLKFF